MATLKGKLLVALPVLRDENFDRTVLYMLEHTADDGAVGVVLSRPSAMTVDEPLPRWMPLASPPAVLFIGGPVARSSVVGLAETVAHDIVAVDLEGDPADGPDKLLRLRIFAGYAGWAPGQLEDELSAGAWLVVDGGPDDVMSTEPEELWRDVLRRQGGRTAAVATFPEDPSWN
jgi:putative transcriptional regulator